MLDTIIDLYHDDDVHDWETVVKGGTVACIHKASEGLSSVDPRYAQRRIWASNAGLPLWGAYHFATGSDGADQANHFLAVAQPDAHTLMALDLETNPNGQTASVQQARDFVSRVFKVTGRFPWVYGSNWFENIHGGGDPILKLCPLWIARYGGKQPIVPPGWTDWTLWQYQAGEEGGDKLPGLELCDRSRFNGTLDELKAIWSK